jgi:hypothetical protein
MKMVSEEIRNIWKETYRLCRQYGMSHADALKKVRETMTDGKSSTRRKWNRGGYDDGEVFVP